jgi:hypothetical protein
MGRGSTLGPLSLLMKGASVPEASRRAGIPAERTAGSHTVDVTS